MPVWAGLLHYAVERCSGHGIAELGKSGLRSEWLENGRSNRRRDAAGPVQAGAVGENQGDGNYFYGNGCAGRSHPGICAYHPVAKRAQPSARHFVRELTSPGGDGNDGGCVR